MGWWARSSRRIRSAGCLLPGALQRGCNGPALQIAARAWIDGDMKKRHKRGEIEKIKIAVVASDRDEKETGDESDGACQHGDDRHVGRAAAEQQEPEFRNA